MHTVVLSPAPTIQAFRGVVPSRRQRTQMIDTVRSDDVREQKLAGNDDMETADFGACLDAVLRERGSRK